MWGVEYAVNRVLDWALLPVGILVLVFWSPVLAAYNLLIRQFNWVTGPSLTGKVVLITGASSGIGEHLAYAFAKKGAKLVLTGLRDDKLRRVAQQCDRLGADDFAVVKGDTSVESDCHRMVNTAINKFGQLDVLVNNAGIINADLIRDTREIEALRRVLDVDFFGYVWMTLHALPYLRRTGGSILVNASVESYMPLPRHSIYSAAKGAVLQFFDTMRAEPVGKDVNITIAFPGATASEITAGKFVDAHGRMVVDQEQRDTVFGPQPMMKPATVAERMVSSMQAKAHYVVVPFWYSLPLLFRLFTPDLLFWALKLQFLPWMPGTPPPSKLMMDMGAAKVLYHKPATSQADAQAAVYEGKVPEDKTQAGGLVEKVVKSVQQVVQPSAAEKGSTDRSGVTSTADSGSAQTAGTGTGAGVGTGTAVTGTAAKGQGKGGAKSGKT